MYQDTRRMYKKKKDHFENFKQNLPKQQKTKQGDGKYLCHVGKRHGKWIKQSPFHRRTSCLQPAEFHLSKNVGPV